MDFRFRSASTGSGTSDQDVMLEHNLLLQWIRRPATGIGLLLGAMLCAGSLGCVQRRMLIRSNPPGAAVYVDDYPEAIGTTPIAVNFTYYGTRKLRLVKEGYETLTVLQPVPTPWYEYPPLDLVSENLVPGELRNYHVFAYQLTPQTLVPMTQLLGRAEQMRRQQPAPIPRTPVPAPAAVPAAAPEPVPTPQPGPAPVQLGPPNPLPPATPLNQMSPPPVQPSLPQAVPPVVPPAMGPAPMIGPSPNAGPAPPAQPGIGEQPLHAIPPSWPAR